MNRKDIKCPNGFNPKRTKTKKGLSNERCMELLGSVINHVSSANNTERTVKELIFMGFTEDELINIFDFGEDDVCGACKELELEM